MTCRHFYRAPWSVSNLCIVDFTCVVVDIWGDIFIFIFFNTFFKTFSKRFCLTTSVVDKKQCFKWLMNPQWPLRSVSPQQCLHRHFIFCYELKHCKMEWVIFQIKFIWPFSSFNCCIDVVMLKDRFPHLKKTFWLKGILSFIEKSLCRDFFFPQYCVRQSRIFVSKDC